MARSTDLDAAATAVIRSLGPQVLRYLRSLLRDEDAAAEAFSQWAENVWRGLSAFRSEGTVRGWCFRLAFNVALNLQNEAWRRRGERLASSAASQLAEDVRTKTAVRVERQRQALDVLRESLTVEERSLLTLRIDQELPWAEIAQALAAEGQRADAAALQKRFERLKERLARMAKEQGLLD
jgi:RNA polymerase sigma-70 factor, ECF subfamily